MKTTKDKIKIMQAYEDGETIRFTRIGAGTCDFLKANRGEPEWDWPNCTYEIVPPPGPQVGDVWEMDNGTRAYIQRIDNEDDRPFWCLLLSETNKPVYSYRLSKESLGKLISTGHAGIIEQLKKLLTPNDD